MVASKMSKGIFLLRNLKDGVPPKILRVAYFALCESHISYGSQIWGHSAIRHRFFGLQRSAIKIIGGLKYRKNSKIAYLTLNLVYSHFDVYVFSIVFWMLGKMSQVVNTYIMTEYPKFCGGVIKILGAMSKYILIKILQCL